MKRRNFIGSALAAGAAGLAARRYSLAVEGTSPSTEVQALAASGKQMTLRQAEIADLRARLRGDVLQPGVADYEHARRIWNGAFDRRPALIARCMAAADVVQAVDFARSHDLLTAVRGGGHSLSGQSVCDGGMMIDLAPMKAIHIDPAARTARVEAGVLLGDFDREAQAFGLATTAGTVTHTGVAGLTLGGGFGRLARKFGLTCDNLLSVDIVTADGTLRTANERENADLFWGVRGGGGNFGVVTSFEFRLHPVGPVLLGGMLLFPFVNAGATVSSLLDIAANAPDELYLTPTLILLPDGQRAIAAEACYCGSVAAGERAVSSLWHVAKPIGGEIAPKPYVELQRGLDAVSVPGRNYFYKSGFVKRVTPALIEEVVQRFTAAPPCVTAIPLIHTGGAISRVKADATACWNRSAERDLLVQSDWADRAETGRNIEAVRTLWRALQPFTEGYYVNTDTPDDEQRLRLTYGLNYARLVQLKNKFDPSNLFRLNANIRPSAVEARP
jgi:FAD/FMN-containing dehydrogenase